jgi:hypothetical protein
MGTIPYNWPDDAPTKRMPGVPVKIVLDPGDGQYFPLREAMQAGRKGVVR